MYGNELSVGIVGAPDTLAEQINDARQCRLCVSWIAVGGKSSEPNSCQVLVGGISFAISRVRVVLKYVFKEAVYRGIVKLICELG
jgi:hypothetical protein